MTQAGDSSPPAGMHVLLHVRGVVAAAVAVGSRRLDLGRLLLLDPPGAVLVELLVLLEDFLLAVLVLASAAGAVGFGQSDLVLAIPNSFADLKRKKG